MGQWELVPWVGHGAIRGFLFLLQDAGNRNMRINFAEKPLEGPG